MPEKTGYAFWGDQGIDLKTMAKALKEYDSETINKLTEYLPTKKQDRFKRAIKLLEDETLSKNEIDGAKKEIKVCDILNIIRTLIDILIDKMTQRNDTYVPIYVGLNPSRWVLPL